MSRFFVQKAWFGGVGLTAGLLGMATERSWLVWVAIALLTVAVALGIVERTAWGRQGGSQP